MWQEGPALKLLFKDWPIRQDLSDNIKILPDQSKPILLIEKLIEDDTLGNRIGIKRFSSYKRLLRVTARVLMMYDKTKPAFSDALNTPNTTNMISAETIWIKEAQIIIQEKLKKGQLKRLVPCVRKYEIIVVGVQSCTKSVHQTMTLSFFHIPITSRGYTQNICTREIT